MRQEVPLREEGTAEWWRTLVEALPEAVIVHVRGRIVFANASAARLFAAPDPQALIGRPALILVHPQSRPLARQRTRRVLARRQPEPPAELRWLRLDGSSFWGEGRPSFVHHRGQPALLAVIRDVSERRHEEQRLCDFAELASNWFWETGPDLRFRWLSSNVETKTGVPAEWHYGKTRAEIAAPDSDPAAVAENMRLMHSRLPFRNFEFKRRGPKGDHWIATSGKPVFDDDGRFLGYRGTARDITAEKEAEIALRESEERYRRLVELAPDAVVVHVDGRIRYANPSAAALLGFPTGAELVGRSVLEFVDRAEHDRIRERWQALARNEAVPPVEMRIRRADGIERWVEVRASTIVDRGERAVLLLGTDVTERRRNQERLVFLARHDPLTGLANRALFFDRLEQAIRLAGRDGHCAGLLLLDLDGFKGLNDSFGHGFGDRVLQAVADRLRGELRSCDTVGRVGGDEFAVVLPHLASVVGAEAVAARLVAALARPVVVDGRTCRIGASMGVAVAPEHARNSTALLAAADMALYRAKALGRGCWATFDPTMAEGVEERRAVEAALRHHLAEGTLELHYQPVVELASGRMVGAEALVRWPKDSPEPVPPDLFVAVAEESGLIRELGRWVLERALDDLARLRQLAGRSLRVAINVSPLELADPGYAGEVADLLARHQLPPAALELEITERVLLERSGDVLATIEQLRDIGVQLSIDDFGTGYSSLIYLKRFPVHRLKLDRAFVRELPDHAEDRAIVEAIVGLARAFVLPLVAEGVERLEQAAYLSQLGVEDGQGWLWSPPVPFTRLASLVEAGPLRVGPSPRGSGGDRAEAATSPSPARFPGRSATVQG